jgi:hypothetical protein
MRGAWARPASVTGESSSVRGERASAQKQELYLM